MVSKGADDKEIAGKLGIHPQTFGAYLKRGRAADQKRDKGEELSEEELEHLELYDVYARARTIPDSTVVAALFNSCQDHLVRRRVTIHKEYDDDGNVIKEVREEEVLVPASVPAQQFYLANKCRLDWAYRPDPAKDDSKESESVIIVAREAVKHE